MSEQPTNWHVTACVHQPITGAQADGLFDTLADAAHGWEPAGVDVDVSGGPCCCRESPAAVARVVQAARAWRFQFAPGSHPSRGPRASALTTAVDALDADADPATERDFDEAAAAAVPVVVGTPPWQVHDSPPPTHGTPAAAPHGGPGWWDYWSWRQRAETAEARVDGQAWAELTAEVKRLDMALRVQMEINNRLRADLQAAIVTIGALRDELSTARRDAAADALDWAAQMFGDPLRLLANLATEVRTGQRTIPTQPATTTEDLPEWERELLNRQEET
jgi:hypothetical protein